MSYRVAFDVTPELFAATGVARYSRELGRALDRRQDCELARFSIGRRTERTSGQTRHLPVPLRVVHPLWRLLSLPRAEQLVGPVDVVHSIDLVAPPTRSPLVVTVHDLAAVTQPALHAERTVEIQRRRLAELGRAAAVIAVSETTAAGLITNGVAAERVHVTPLGLTPLPPPTAAPVADGPFVLAVGTLEPRKAHEVLVSAFAAAGNGEARLVFAGPTGGRAEMLRELAAGLGVGDRLTILGAVDDRILSDLYRRASVLCMPSRSEGFGLPVLEAMSLGVPVVASDIPAVREVAGDAAIRVPPGDERALAEALVNVLNDPELRGRLRERGLTRAACFTWDATAAATVRAYASALGVNR